MAVLMILTPDWKANDAASVLIIHTIIPYIVLHVFIYRTTLLTTRKRNEVVPQTTLATCSTTRKIK